MLNTFRQMVKTQELAPTDKERDVLSARVEELRGAMGDMVFITFPGDEFAAGALPCRRKGIFPYQPVRRR